MIGGHGHVRPRPDGVKARCGGPALCRECAKEAAELAASAGQRPGGYDDAVASSSRLVVFLYLLGRDHLPLGVIEKLIHDARAADLDAKFSNDFLAAYALEVAARLGGVSEIDALRAAKRTLTE